MQFTFSVTPAIAPVFFTGRVKGRLQHALREAGTPAKFSRKVSFRAIGHHHSAKVQKFIAQQVPKERFVDLQFEQMLFNFTKVGDVDRFQKLLSSCSGRHWYNLHFIFVVAGRDRSADEALQATGVKHRYDLVANAWWLDRLHVAKRGNILESPFEIALSILNSRVAKSFLG